MKKLTTLLATIFVANVAANGLRDALTKEVYAACLERFETQGYSKVKSAKICRVASNCAVEMIFDTANDPALAALTGPQNVALGYYLGKACTQAAENALK